MNINKNNTFYSIDGRQLNMTIKYIDAVSVEITLTNLSYAESRNKFLWRLSYILLAYGFIISITNQIAFHLIFTAAIGLQFYFLLQLVQNEKIIFVKDFCLQSCGTFFLGRKRHEFLSTTNIHNIVINEVIYGIKVIYVMIILMKGQEFRNRPIIPLLSSLNPRVECLKVLYNLLQDLMGKS